MRLKIFYLVLVVMFAAGAIGLSCHEEKAQTNATVQVKNTELATVKVTFVELGSVRCKPCKAMQPIMADIEKEYKDQVKVVFHDVWLDENKKYIDQYKVRIIPTQVFLDKDGKEYFRHEGFFPKAELVKVLKQKGVK